MTGVLGDWDWGIPLQFGIQIPKNKTSVPRQALLGCSCNHLMDTYFDLGLGVGFYSGVGYRSGVGVKSGGGGGYQSCALAPNAPQSPSAPYGASAPPQGPAPHMAPEQCPSSGGWARGCWKICGKRFALKDLFYAYLHFYLTKSTNCFYKTIYNFLRHVPHKKSFQRNLLWGSLPIDENSPVLSTVSFQALFFFAFGNVREK